MMRLMLVLLVCLASGLFGQYQNPGKWQGDVGQYEQSFLVMSALASDSVKWIGSTNDTLKTSSFLGYPIMSCEMTVDDTNASDSIGVVVDLEQSYDATRWTYVKTLDWFKTSSTSVSTVPSAGTWACDLTSSAIRTFNRCRLSLRSVTGNRVTSGVWARIRITGYSR